MNETETTEGTLAIYFKSGRVLVFTATADEYAMLSDDEEEDAFVTTDNTVVQVDLGEVEAMTFKVIE